VSITAITIENFKGIGEPVTVPLRPLTLLFGANASGKSTIIQALQYAWEVLENNNPDADRTELGGGIIDLGGFRSLVHGHDLGREIGITVHFRGWPKTLEYALPDGSVSGDLDDEWIGTWVEVDNLNFDNLAVRVASGWHAEKNQAVVTEYEIFFNDSGFARIRGGGYQNPILDINSGHEFFGCPPDDTPAKTIEILSQVRRIYEERSEYEWEVLERSTGVDTGQTKRHPPQLATDRVVPDWRGRLRFERGALLKGMNGEYIEGLLTQLLFGAGYAVLTELRRLRYLGPLRQIPPRNYEAPRSPDRSRWATGLGAWDALLRSSKQSENCTSLVDKCSRYMSKVLNLGYSLRREERIHLDANGEFMTELRGLASSDEKAGVPRKLGLLLEGLDSLPCEPVLKLRDERNNVDLVPQDIGVGVSQMLPVVVGAAEPNCTIFAVEQPELHIHPAVQVNLADIFLREALEDESKKRIFLLETHSEHFVLRIMKRMRQSAEGKLPSGFPPVTPIDVAVLLVEVISGKTIVREMLLNERGELVKAWPGGFFEEALRETL
jgi:AAA ATPase-like protein